MEKKTEKRCEQLSSLGLVFNFLENAYIGEDDIINDFYVPALDISFTDDEKWNKIIKELQDEKERRLIKG